VSRSLRTPLVLAGLAAVGVGGAALTTAGDDGYVLEAKFRQAGGLRQGFTVRIDGAPVGKIDKLELGEGDVVVAKLLLDESAAPVGRDVRATARAADLLGEKFIDLEPGDRRRPAPSGTVIPPRRTALAVELDDVINAIDLPTRQALRAFLNEQGSWFVGRGNDLGAALAALPGSLDRSGRLLAAFATENATLGKLVEESDRVLAAVAGERRSLGRLVAGASGTFATLGARSDELEASIRQAPATLASARRALRSLEKASVPLGAAAKGLGDTAPQLTATMRELPGFAKAARPTLATLRRVSPTLTKLGRDATPVVRRLGPLTKDLDEFAAAFEPVTETLDTGIGDILGVLEGWARATQARDSAGHLFRFGLTVSSDTISSLAKFLATPDKKKAKPAPRRPARTEPIKAGLPRLPKADLPKAKLPKLPAAPELKPGEGVDRLLDKLGVGGTEQGKGQATNGDLLDFLLGP
jgi:phospholipid/cholesterol/gamma-HCH transport system substrate-binding protein